MTNLLASFWNDDCGQDMAEYAVVLGGVVAMAIVVVGLLSGKIQAFITGLSFS
jgi:Flp pilus assembly pilin Flp